MHRMKKAVSLSEYLPEETDVQVALEAYHALSDTDVATVASTVQLHLERFQEAGDALVEAKRTGYVSRPALEAAVDHLPTTHPINSFTRHPTTTNYTVGLESLVRHFLDAFRSLFQAVVGVSGQLSTWVGKRLRKLTPVNESPVSGATERLLKTKETVDENLSLVAYITPPKEWSRLTEVLLFDTQATTALFNPVLLDLVTHLLLKGGMGEFFNQLVAQVKDATEGEALNRKLRQLLDDTFTDDVQTSIHDAETMLSRETQKYQRLSSEQSYHQYITDTDTSPFPVGDVVPGFNDAYGIAETLVEELSALEKSLSRLGSVSFPENSTGEDVEVFQALVQEAQLLSLTWLERGSEYLMHLITLLSIKEDHEAQLATHRIQYAELLEQQSAQQPE